MSIAFRKFDLTGKTAVVTAGGSGLGYYMTRGLMRSGAKVLIAARRENVLAEAAEQLSGESDAGEVLYTTVDLGDRDSIQSFSDYAIETLGGVDIFIGNAATENYEPIDSIRDENIDQTFQINVSSNMELTRNFLPYMRRNKWGRIIFSSSITSQLSEVHAGKAVYGATKSALNSFARTVAVEAGRDGITANSLTLGAWTTTMYHLMMDKVSAEHGPEEARAISDAYASVTAVGRLGRPDEIEGLIQFIASDAGSYYTGTTTSIDGGMAIKFRPDEVPENPVYPPEQ